MHKLNFDNLFIVPVNTVPGITRKVSHVHFIDKSHIKLFWSPALLFSYIKIVCGLWWLIQDLTVYYD